jgi:excisionase family DNA binding protein
LPNRSTREDRWLSVEEIAEHVGVTKDSIYRWIERRGLPAHKVGKLWKFKKDEVDEWVRTGHARDDKEEA